MGDDELNFTDEEARCWADDPRNHAQKSPAVVSVIVACVLLLITLIAIMVAAGSDRPKSDDGAETHIRALPVR
jgi:hypothetical protein